MLYEVITNKKIQYVSICSPNYLHDAHIRFALRVGADAICEKPLVLNPWNVDAFVITSYSIHYTKLYDWFMFPPIMYLMENRIVPTEKTIQPVLNRHMVVLSCWGNKRFWKAA